jgi:hypothetical protein
MTKFFLLLVLTVWPVLLIGSYAAFRWCRCAPTILMVIGARIAALAVFKTSRCIGWSAVVGRIDRPFILGKGILGVEDQDPLFIQREFGSFPGGFFPQPPVGGSKVNVKM